MAEDPTPIVVAPAPAPTSVAVDPTTNSLSNPTFIVAMTCLAVAAGTILAVFLKGNQEVQNVIAGTAIGSTLGAVSGFYFGASKHPQQNGS